MAKKALVVDNNNGLISQVSNSEVLQVGTGVQSNSGTISIRPTTDATNGVVLANSSGTGVAAFDTVNGRLRIGDSTTAPVAKLHIASGGGAGGVPPVVLTPDSVVTSPVAGAIEYDGSNWYLTNSTSRNVVNTCTGYTNGSTSYNTALGIGAGTSVSSGTTNTFVGYNAGNLVTTGSGNLIAGSSAGAALTTQSYNTALGDGAMQAATGGSCTSVGYQAAYYGTGSSNVGVGYQAAKGNTTASGGSNVAVGASSLAVYTSGASNAMVGYQTGAALTTGTSNAVIGGYAGLHITTGGYNTLVGGGAGSTLTTGSNNILLGYNCNVSEAGDTYSIVVGNGVVGKGNGNTVIGVSTQTTDTWLRGDKLRVGNETATDKYFYFQNSSSGGQPGFKWDSTHSKLQWSNDGTTYNDFSAGSSLTGYTYDSPIRNTALGAGAGVNAEGATGPDNVFVGYNAGNQLTTGGSNSLIGSNAGAVLTTQSDNVALGRAAMGAATGNACTFVGSQAGRYGTGNYNVGVGYQAAEGYTSSNGYYNTAVGTYALAEYTSGSYNAAFGYAAGEYLTTGYGNCLLGPVAGLNLASGSYNTIIGWSANVTASDTNNSTVIGASATGKGNYTTVLGNTDVTDTWLRGDKLHVGNEGGGDKYFYFQNSETGVQPGFKWDSDYLKLQWSNDGINYNDIIYLAGYTRSAPPYNTALGDGTGGPSSGADNTFVGYQAGGAMTTGTDNTFIGYLAGRSVQSSSSSVAVGSGAMDSNTGDNNTAVGTIAARYGSGSNNVAVGNSALTGTTSSTGANNTAVGVNAGMGTVGGSNNVFIGYNAAQTPTNCSNVVAIGCSAGRYMNYSSGDPASVFVGYQAGQGVNTGATGYSNTAVGWGVLHAYTTAYWCVAIGQNAGASITTGAFNTLVGTFAGHLITNGIYNILIGSEAGKYTNGGSYNICVGNTAGYSIGSATYNIFIGQNAGYTTTGGSNIIVGHLSDVRTATDANSIIIGKGVTGKGSKTTVIGSNDATNGTTDTWLRGTTLHVGNEPGTAGDALLVFENSTGAADTQPGFKAGSDGLMYYRNASAASWTTLDSLSDIRLKKNVEDLPYGLDFLQTLRPVLFDWRTPQGPVQTRKQMGLVAQELKKACEDAGFSPGLVDDSGKYMSVRYEQLVPALIKAVQELSAKVAELEQKLKEK
jgi:hypothetical protein